MAPTVQLEPGQVHETDGTGLVTTGGPNGPKPTGLGVSAPPVVKMIPGNGGTVGAGAATAGISANDTHNIVSSDSKAKRVFMLEPSSWFKQVQTKQMTVACINGVFRRPVDRSGQLLASVPKRAA